MIEIVFDNTMFVWRGLVIPVGVYPAYLIEICAREPAPAKSLPWQSEIIVTF